MSKRMDGRLESTYYRREDYYSVECAQCRSIQFLPLKFEKIKEPVCTGCQAILSIRNDNHPIFKGDSK